MAEEPRGFWQRFWQFWQSLPGILTGTAALVGAVVTLISALRGCKTNEIRPTPTPTVVAAPSIAQPVNPREGKIGDELSTAEWTFQVLKIHETDEYVERYYEEKIIRPRGKNDSLVIVDARLKNPLHQTQSPVLTERESGNTGLIDDTGHSYQPIDYDARQWKDKWVSGEAAAVLPDAIADFALVFSVPRGTKPKSLVFTLKTYPSNVGTDVKVWLTN
jgi:hypothetical protein